MKTAQYFTGVLLIALVVAGSILGVGMWLDSKARMEGQAETLAPAAQAPIPFASDIPLVGTVKLEWAAPGTLFDILPEPSEEERDELPDLGTFDLAFLLQRSDEFNVDGYVDIATSYIFTGYHTIHTTLFSETTTMRVGPQVGGVYDDGEFSLLSERFAATTQAGDSIERQFGLWLSDNSTPGVLVGNYRETVWGIGLQPMTVVGTFTLNDVRVRLTATNQTPDAVPLLVNTTTNTPVGITLGGSDPDGDPITFIVVTTPLKGTLSGTAPNLTYTPANNFQGQDSFVYKVNDGQVDSSTVAVTLIVAAPNTAPVAGGQTVNALQGQARAITLNGSDADNDALTFSIVTQPANGTLTGTPPNVTYTSNGSFSGQDSFTFKVNDGKVDSPAATVTVNVNAAPPPNSPPVASGQTVNAMQGQPRAITLSGTDADSDALTFSIVTQPANGTLTGTPPNVTYTSNGSFSGQDSFTFKVNDGQADSPAATVTVNVSAPPQNTPPVANGQAVSAVQGQPKSVTLTGTDADLDPLTFSIVTQPANGTLTGTPPNVSYTSNGGFTGQDSFTFKVNDGQADSPAATVTVNVTAPPNTPPVANGQTVNAVQGQARAITLTGTDADSDALTFSIVTQPANGTLTGTPPNVTYTSNGGFTGQDSFTFKVNDGKVDSPAATVTVNVTPPNTAPVANGQTVDAQQAQPKAITLTGTDADNNPLTFSVLTLPTNGTLTGTPPNVTYTSNGGFSGQDSFTFKVNDGQADSPAATVTVNVTAPPPPNTPPVANGQMVSAVQGLPMAVTLTGTDVDNDALTFSIVTQPAGGTLTGTPPNVTYTSIGGFSGQDSFTFKVNDGKADSPAATVTVNVSAPPPQNTPPVADDQTVNAVQEEATAIKLTGTDADSDALTFSIVTQPANGTLTGTPPNVSYTSNGGFIGQDSFTFKVNDGQVDSPAATVTVNVTAAVVGATHRLHLPMLGR